MRIGKKGKHQRKQWSSGAGNGGITAGKTPVDETAALLMKWGKDEMTWYKELVRWKWKSGRG